MFGEFFRSLFKPMSFPLSSPPPLLGIGSESIFVIHDEVGDV